VWARLASLLFGASVHALALTLAVFLAWIAIGAAAGRRHLSLGSALCGSDSRLRSASPFYSLLPYGLGLAFEALGADAFYPAAPCSWPSRWRARPSSRGPCFTHALLLERPCLRAPRVRSLPRTRSGR
jgi:hypothetical protein